MSEAERMHENFESWREMAVRKVQQYKRSKRFAKARAYWEGYAQACANAKCIAYGYTMAARTASTPTSDVNEGHHA